MVSAFSGKHTNPASAPCSHQSWGQGSLRHIAQKNFVEAPLLCVVSSLSGLPAGFVVASISMLNTRPVTQNTAGWCSVGRRGTWHTAVIWGQSISGINGPLKIHQLTYPFQWWSLDVLCSDFVGFGENPAFQQMMIYPLVRGNSQPSLYPWRKKMRNHYKYYKCIKLAEKVKTKHQPNPAGKKCFQPLHAAGGRISCHSHGDPKGPSTVLSAGSICLFPLCLASLCQCLTCVYKAVCAQNPGGASAPTETLQ